MLLGIVLCGDLSSIGFEDLVVASHTPLLGLCTHSRDKIKLAFNFISGNASRLGEVRATTKSSKPMEEVLRQEEIHFRKFKAEKDWFRF